MDEQELKTGNEELDEMTGGLIDEDAIPEEAYLQDAVDEDTAEEVDELYGTAKPARPRKVNAKTRRENPLDITEEDIDYIYEKRRTYC